MDKCFKSILNGRAEGRRGIYYFENSFYINIDGNLKINETKTRNVEQHLISQLSVVKI